MRISVPIFPGVDELDALGPCEVLRNAAAHGADLRVELVALGVEEATEPVVGGHGIRILPDRRVVAWDELETEENRPDLLLAPGGGWVARAAQGVRAEIAQGDLPRLIARLHAAGVLMASVCTGGMLLAAAGITTGRPAITHHGAVADLRASGAEVIEARVVDVGDLITAGGVTSGLDLALWLVERFYGPALAQRVERQMEYERRGVVWRRDTASQAGKGV